MRGTRRRPYVDMVKPGNNADGAPQRGAGAPVSGDATAEARGRPAENRGALGPLPGRTSA